MQVMWEADSWLMVRDIRDRMDYAPVAYTTVSKVTSILYEKDLLTRRLDDCPGKPGPAAWWYRAARPINEHIGELIARLMDYSPDPEAALAYALSARRRTSTGQPRDSEHEATTADQAAGAEPSKHALHALTTNELNARRRELMRAIKGISADAPIQADLRRWLDQVLAEEKDRTRTTDV